MNRFIIAILSLTFLLSSINCRKKESSSIAGKGGNANITLDLIHHYTGRNIINGKVYIKYGAVELPSKLLFDDSVTAIEDSGDTAQIAVFVGLENGNYYFYGTGYDTSYHKPVHGGISYTITSQLPQTFNLFVSEE